MNSKPYEVPFDVNQLIVLDNRLRLPHYMKDTITSDLKRSKFGQSGEKDVYYQLQFLPQNEYYIFHNLRLFENNRSFQIDFLVIWKNFIFILDVKNFKGFVYFNDIGQLVHIKDDNSEEVYESPVHQAERHKIQLQNWLFQKGFPSIPIEAYAVLGSATKFLQKQNTNTSFHNRIVPCSNIFQTILKYTQQSNNYKKINIKQISTKLLSSHSPIQRDIFKKYNLNQSDIVTGVRCTKM